MSRVEDDRQADRVTQRLLQEKQRAEAKSKQLREGENAFSKLVQQSQADKGQTQQQRETRQSLAQQVLARVTKESAGSETRQQEGATSRQAAQRQETGKAHGRMEAKTNEERVQAALSGETERTAEGHQADAAHGEQTAAGRKYDQGVSSSRSESRSTDAKAEGDSKADDRNADLRSAGRSGQKGDVKADADSSGGQSGGNKDQKGGGEAAAAAGFRFNPALMAPVPVAKPKPNAGSDRLRAIANEIAQKIVERVRVGTNGAGNAEFQIDLRSNVLSGLSIKLSAKNGKIQAVFSGSDRDVLKMIQEQSEGLKSQLESRGLKLEELRFEARA
ncbi:MAG: flagellar hook-length control protein FliK [Myxococcaceae bacterium]|nr:flagellar hook-length control protein FliK [Myxococcaceae bacterium]